MGLAGLAKRRPPCGVGGRVGFVKRWGSRLRKSSAEVFGGEFVLTVLKLRRFVTLAPRGKWLWRSHTCCLSSVNTLRM